jgi:hypothetical protein
MRDELAIAHLNLLPLVGSDRQVDWAAKVGAGRLAAMLANPRSPAACVPACRSAMPNGGSITVT